MAIIDIEECFKYYDIYIDMYEKLASLVPYDIGHIIADQYITQFNTEFCKYFSSESKRTLAKAYVDECADDEEEFVKEIIYDMRKAIELFEKEEDEQLNKHNASLFNKIYGLYQYTCEKLWIAGGKKTHSDGGKIIKARIDDYIPGEYVKFLELANTLKFVSDERMVASNILHIAAKYDVRADEEYVDAFDNILSCVLDEFEFEVNRFSEDCQRTSKVIENYLKDCNDINLFAAETVCRSMHNDFSFLIVASSIILEDEE